VTGGASGWEAARPVRVTASDGTVLGAWRAGRGSPLLLVHGTGADHTRWAPVLPGLARCFTVYALDRRGRGASGDGPDWSIQREVGDLVDVLEAIGGRVDVVAHSFGAARALEAALRTERIRRLVTYEPGGVRLPGADHGPPPALSRLRDLLRAGRLEEVLLTFLREVVATPEQELALLRSRPSWPGRVAAAHTVVREVAASEEHRFPFAELSGLRVPTLMLEGSESPPALRSAAEHLHRLLPGSRLVVLPGQGHAAMDTAPDLLVAEVVAFLAEG